MPTPTDTTTTPQPWYCSREDVKRSMDIATTASRDAQVDRAIAAGSRSIEALCRRRHLYPAYETNTFDWPNEQISLSYRQWLNNQSLISFDTIVSGGVTLDPTGVLLRPDWGPPFTWVEVSLGSSDMFSVSSTWQRSTSITGWWGWDDRHTAAGTVNGSLTSSSTTVTCTDSFHVGVGSIITVDSERMTVTEKAWTTTGQTLQGGTLPVGAASTSVAVVDGTQYLIGEVIQLDTETMLITDITGNTLIVKRAFDGTVLAQHTAGTTINAKRSLTVVRGAVGTTAATHSNGAAISVWQSPPLIRDLAVAYATTQLTQETANYARMAGDEGARDVTGRGLDGLESEVLERYGRQFRLRSV